MATPLTTDTAERLVLFPDWAGGIDQTTGYSTSVQRAKSGLEQRSRMRKSPVLTIKYLINSERDTAALNRLLEIRKESRKPLLVPWWPNAAKTGAAMTANSVTISTNPIAADFDKRGEIFIWNSEDSWQFRTIATRSGRNFTLEPETETIIFPAGSFVAPVRKALREIGEDQQYALTKGDSSEQVTFKTI